MSPQMPHPTPDPTFYPRQRCPSLALSFSQVPGGTGVGEGCEVTCRPSKASGICQCGVRGGRGEAGRLLDHTHLQADSIIT